MAKKARREEQQKIGKIASKFGPKLLDDDNDNDEPQNGEADDSDGDWIDIMSPKTIASKSKKDKKKEIETPGVNENGNEDEGDYDDNDNDKSEEKKNDDDDDDIPDPGKEDENNKFKSASVNPKRHFQRGEKYILADLGGGTADIACHEILSEYNVREIYKPSGGPYGATYIDVEFIKLLKKIISRKTIDDFRTHDPYSYIELVSNFQRSKVSFWRNRDVDGTIIDENSKRAGNNIQLPLDFINYLEDKMAGYDIEEDEENNDNDGEEYDDEDKWRKIFADYSNDDGIKKGWIEVQDEYLVMKNEVWEYLFDKVVTPICDHIEGLIKKLKDKHKFKYLLLAGGFCESKYVQGKLLKRLGHHSDYKLAIVVPRRPIMQVVTGAALYCKNQCYVRSRQLRNTIGIEIRDNLIDFKEKYDEYLRIKRRRNDDDSSDSEYDDDEKNETLIYDEDQDDDNKNDDNDKLLIKKYENDEYIKKNIVEDKHLLKKFIDKVFYRFVNAGDQLQIDDPPKIQYFKPVDKDSNEIEIKLYEFEEDKSLTEYTDIDILDKLNRNIFKKINSDLLNEKKQIIIKYFIDNKIDGQMLLHKKRKDFINNVIEFIDNDNEKLKNGLNLLYLELMKQEDNKLFTNDQGCNLLATKKIKLPKEWVDKNDGKSDIPIAFFFGDTQIQVYIGIDGLNEKDAQINLEYKYYHV